MIGVRLPALGEITERSVVGVKAPGGKQCGKRIVNGRRQSVFGGEILTHKAAEVRGLRHEARPENPEHIRAGDGRASGQWNEEWKQSGEAEHSGHDSLLDRPVPDEGDVRSTV